MKKLIFSFFLLISFNSNAQCELNFITILNSATLNASDFETYYLSKGFEYYSENNMFACLNSDGSGISNSIQRTITETLSINYSTKSKDTYLSIKEEINKTQFKYLGSKNDNDLILYFYSLDNIIVTFSSITFNDEKNYFVSIQIKE